jgi:hypothetical protein
VGWVKDSKSPGGRVTSVKVAEGGRSRGRREHREASEGLQLLTS